MILATAPAPAPLRGELTPPGDKSISHRALILGCLAEGVTRVEGLLEGEDVKATAAACRQLGMAMRRDGQAWVLEGVGERGLQPPSAALDMGNSGTAMRLLAGVLAAQPFDSVLVGDASLSQRPMNRIVAPLRQMGAHIETGPGGKPPLRIHASDGLHGIAYDSPVASAQVKSCLLLAGLYADGVTAVREPLLSRDHTENMLPAFGVPLAGDRAVQGGARLRVTKGQAEPSGRRVAIVVSQGGLEDLLSPLGFALAAVLEGAELRVRTAFWFAWSGFFPNTAVVD